MPFILLLVQEHGEGGAGPGSPFQLEPGLIFWTWVVFIALFFGLRKYIWPVIVRTVEERERRMQKLLEDAEKANALAQRLLEEHKKAVAATKAEAQEIMAKSKVVAQKERELLLAKAREEYEALLERARKDIDAEKEKALVALRREAVELSIAAASRVIEANLDTEANRRLVTEYLASLEKEAKH